MIHIHPIRENTLSPSSRVPFALTVIVLIQKFEFKISFETEGKILAGKNKSYTSKL